MARRLVPRTTRYRGAWHAHRPPRFRPSLGSPAPRGRRAPAQPAAQTPRLAMFVACCCCCARPLVQTMPCARFPRWKSRRMHAPMTRLSGIPSQAVPAGRRRSRSAACANARDAAGPFGWPGDPIGGACQPGSILDKSGGCLAGHPGPTPCATTQRWNLAEETSPACAPPPTPASCCKQNAGRPAQAGEQSSRKPAWSHQSTPAPATGRMMAVLRVAHPQRILPRHRAAACYDAKRPGLDALASGTSCRVVVDCHIPAEPATSSRRKPCNLRYAAACVCRSPSATADAVLAREGVVVM